MKKELIFNGNEKKIYATDEENVVLIHYTDTITCYNKVKRARIADKGIYTNKISALLFDFLKENGVRTHFIRLINDREQLCHKIGIVPIEVGIHNIAAGTMARLLGMEDGLKLRNTVVDLRYDNPKLGKTLVNDTMAVALGHMSATEVGYVQETAMKINDLLRKKFDESGIELVDMKLEFGRAADGTLILSDEISPDKCRLWDKKTGEKLDKDRFRHDEGSVTEAYRKVYEALEKPMKKL